ncbi:hypothetical protein ILYODFUR_034103 [Ilyodon furcidens]|uniref:Uncharacterized protein n=1 Tax=Ilyodon furcidens TaxID=33524 RepID=A0ABV0VKW4_9TELE
MGTRKSSVGTLNVSVHTVQSIISPCRNGDVLVKSGQSVRQFYVFKVPSNHLNASRCFVCSELMVSCNSFSASLALALAPDGMQTMVTNTAVNTRGRWYGRHFTVICSITPEE